VVAFPHAGARTAPTLRTVRLSRAPRGAPATSKGVVTLKRPVTSVRKGATVATSGSIASVSGAVVYLQIRSGSGSWSNAVRATVKGTTLTAKVTLARKGGYQLRYAIAAGSGGRYAAGYSTAYGVRVS
jgi:hypothetical protein